MPLLATRGAASARGFGMFASLGGSYWLGSLAGGSPNISYAVAVDGSGNVYLCGQSFASGFLRFQIAKYNASGVIQWQRELGGASDDRGYGVAVDISGNVYVCGRSSAAGTGVDIQIAKYNTSGTLQWQRRLSGSGSSSIGQGIAVDASSNVYISGGSDFSGTQDFQIAKYNTSGTIQWQRRLGSVDSNYSHGVAVDGSGNIYACGYTNVSGTFDFQIAKYDTSGSLQWQRRLSGANSDIAYGIAVDGSSNVYVCGESGPSGANRYLEIAKYNTSGTLQWQRQLGIASGNAWGYSVAADNSGNVYVCGRSFFTWLSSFQIAKYNTSGVLQWQRRLGNAGSGSAIGRGIAVDGLGNIYFCGENTVSGSTAFLFGKVPGDGSKMGTYTVGSYSLTYTDTSLDDLTSSLTSATSTLTDAASSLTDGASSLNDAASSLTSSVTTL